MSVNHDDLAVLFNGENQEILALRQKQLDNLEKIHYPKIGKIKLDTFHLDKLNVKKIIENRVNEIPEEIVPFIDDKTNCVIVRDGNLIYSNLDENFNDVEIITYNDALKENKQEALDIFHENFKRDSDHKLMSLNITYQNSGLLIRVKKNAVIKEALKLYIIGDKSDMVHHTYLIAEQSSEFTLVEKCDNIQTIKVNMVSETFVNENAKLNYVAIDRFCEGTNAFIDRRGYVSKDAKLIYALGQLNDGNTISNNHVKLLGKNSFAETRNVLFTEKDKTHAVTINIEHLSELSQGNIVNHGIVKDKAYLHIDGIGKIHQGMKNSNAQQSTNVITLSDDAKVSANPYLLIDEYDVMAGHGAGIGKVDEEQLYYLMSRGLSKKEAEKLIILGFLYPIIEMIDSDQIKESFVQTIERKLSI